MKQTQALVNGVSVTINIPETFLEYREGARLKNSLELDEGYLFNFRKNDYIILENSGVNYDLRVFYFDKFKKFGTSLESKVLIKNDSSPISSSYVYPIALELRKDFCDLNNLNESIILSLKDDLN